MTNYLKKSIIVGVYIEVLVLILWILFDNRWIYNIVSKLSKYSDLLPYLFGVIFVINGILLIVLVLAAFIIDKVDKVKNNK